METLVSTTLAGCFASVAESYITYPLEYLKVREQIAIKAPGQRYELENLTKVFLKGSNIFAFGNVLKTCVRFNTFSWATKFMADTRGSSRVSAPEVVTAGILTGIAETLVVVPFESIKTTMIEASGLGIGAAKGVLPIAGSPGTIAVSRHHPTQAGSTPTAGSHGKQVRPVRPKGVAPDTSRTLYEVKPLNNTLAAVRHMYKERGLRAFVQGFNPTVTRQVANSFIRFTTYNSFRQLLVPSAEGEDLKSISLGMTAVIAGLTAATEAIVTQPIDVIKTRMQTTNGIKLYGNSLLCAYRVCSEEGVTKLWAGVVPRWLRIWASGAIMWAVYESASKQIAKAMKEHPFKLE